MIRSIFLLLALLLVHCQASRNTGAALPWERDIPKSDKKKNVIFLIGDGMGLGQISATMFSNKNYLQLERFKVIGLHKPYSADDLITDSAAGATAFAIGKKTKNGYIGVDASQTPHKTILEQADHYGYATGMIASSSVVHATPASFMAHQAGREDYEAIAKDYLHTEFELLIGGGKKYFNRRVSDNDDLLQLFLARGYTVLDYFEHDLMEWELPAAAKLIFFTADGEPLPVSSGRNYLPRATSLGIQFLSQKPSKGFFLMVEGSQIDWGGHANDIDYIISETLDFDAAVKHALDFAEKDENTLVIVTADHETGGLAINPGSSFAKINAAFTTKKHTASLIPVFAYGPGSEMFAGIYENTEIYTKLRKFLFE